MATYKIEGLTIDGIIATVDPTSAPGQSLGLVEIHCPNCNEIMMQNDKVWTCQCGCTITEE